MDLDLTGTKCPITLLRFRQQMQKLKPGDSLTVTYDDSAFVSDLLAYCLKGGHTYKRVSDKTFFVTRG